MAYTTINKSTDYFNPVAYTGNGASDRAVTSGFATDFVWIKNRNTTDDHVIFDKVRGGTKYVYTNATQAESTYSGLDLTFESTGVDVGSYTTINNNGSNLISYHWKANGAGSANTDGSISSTVSANITSGFSIVSFTGTGANATVGHGLGVAPKMVICKNRSSAVGWSSWHTGIGDGTKYILLNTTQATLTASNIWNSTTPTSSVISVGSHSSTNESGSDMIAYCFAEKTGFSKFGSYTGNGSTDGTFVYTGFKPAWLMVKKTSATVEWYILDNKRDAFNVSAITLAANSSSADNNQNNVVDFLSNGFKLRATASGMNNSGDTYIYMAFAEAPLVGTNNIPATAR